MGRRHATLPHASDLFGPAPLLQQCSDGPSDAGSACAIGNRPLANGDTQQSQPQGSYPVSSPDPSMTPGLRPFVLVLMLFIAFLYCQLFCEYELLRLLTNTQDSFFLNPFNIFRKSDLYTSIHCFTLIFTLEYCSVFPRAYSERLLKPRLPPSQAPSDSPKLAFAYPQMMAFPPPSFASPTCQVGTMSSLSRPLRRLLLRRILFPICGCGHKCTHVVHALFIVCWLAGCALCPCDTGYME